MLWTVDQVINTGVILKSSILIFLFMSEHTECELNANVPVVEENEIITPISEWPIVEVEEETSQCHTRSRETTELEEGNIDCPKRVFHSTEKEDGSLKKKLKLIKNTLDSCQDALDGDGALKEPTITAKIAKWWRRKKLQGTHQDIPKCEPSSMIHYISRLPECRSFLQKERKRLLTMMELTSGRADTFAALASLEDYLANFSLALNYIERAVKIEPNSAEYLWLREKISMQCQVLREQSDAREKVDRNLSQLPPIMRVPRVSGKSLSVADFRKNFLNMGKPVIITDVVADMTDVPFDYSLVNEHAGETTITTKEASSDSLAWAKLENKRETTVAELIQGIQADSVKDVLFDWSLPIHCPSLAHKISLPKYFKNNFLLQTTPGSLYRESWPSLFIAPKDATTQLHIDAFHSHFWMALFQGEKRWTFFDGKDMAFLYPQWFQSMDPVFEVNLAQPDLARFPLLSLTHPQQCVLKEGELLFVPAGSPHFVENLTPTLAISSNYVDHSNFEKVCEELKVNSFQDQRASDLLSQLQDPVFLKNKNV